MFCCLVFTSKTEFTKTVNIFFTNTLFLGIKFEQSRKKLELTKYKISFNRHSLVLLHLKKKKKK